MKKFRRKQHGKKMAEPEPKGMNIKNSTEGKKDSASFLVNCRYLTSGL